MNFACNNGYAIFLCVAARLLHRIPKDLIYSVLYSHSTHLLIYGDILQADEWKGVFFSHQDMQCLLYATSTSHAQSNIHIT